MIYNIFRLTIPLGLAIAFVSAIPQYMGYGPLFFFNSGSVCKDYGWRTLIYINNFYPVAEEVHNLNEISRDASEHMLAQGSLGANWPSS